jgi:hypothetical protein
LDCLVDFGRHGPWLRVPLGKALASHCTSWGMSDTYLLGRPPMGGLPMLLNGGTAGIS